MSQSCALYRHFDTQDVLLYTGISDNLGLRTHTHSKLSIWVRFAVRAEAVWYRTREEAIVAERSAIRTENPLFNKHTAEWDKERIIEYLIRNSAWDLLPPFLSQPKKPVEAERHTEILSVRLTEHDYDRFTLLAHKKHVKPSVFFRIMILNWLEVHSPELTGAQNASM